jgi:hypothetical protein
MRSLNNIEIVLEGIQEIENNPDIASDNCSYPEEEHANVI